ncbi:GNAT family N-acetyltransferase [Camelliibacillus cellulosilyticus]|uniref:GNAT family N-acetyltransferase n=1 Tax=Camelliibacillus cellulosilyticus TaxID=2174486 RepID=A0ABV9GSH3_9BACL
MLSHCKVLDGRPHYFVIEAFPETFTTEVIHMTVREGLDQFKNGPYQSFTVTLNQQQLSNELISFLGDNGFEKVGTQFFYRRELSSVSPNQKNFDLKNLHSIDDDFFKDIWEQARVASKNAPESTSIDHLFEGLKEELGPNYESYCHIAFKDGLSIGMTIPHPEPGTVDEGRIFYIGILPEHRGKGFGQLLHDDSLALLKALGLNVYIGATGAFNVPMQMIFEKNHCQLFDKRTSFRLMKE